jgi:DNA-binding transcriptional LysR family regulator
MRDLKSLEAFVWIVRLGGFRAAAARMNTTQPSISARIDQLERYLGVTLFEPPNLRKTLTKEGTVVLGYAEQILGLMGDLRTAISAPGTLRGVLRIGVVETLVHSLMPRLIEVINVAYPNVTIDMMVDTTDVLSKQLVEGKVDVSMQVGAVADARAISLPLCHLPLGWVISPSLPLPEGPVSIHELTRWPVLSFSHNSPLIAEMQRAFTASGVKDLRLWGSSSLTMMVKLAMDGLGSCILPLVTVNREVARKRLRILEVHDFALPENPFFVSYLRTPDSFLNGVVAEHARKFGLLLEKEGRGEKGSK